MFTLLFIILPIVAYLAVAGFAVVPFASHMKAKEIPKPVYMKYAKRYDMEFTDEQKKAREFWECVMAFSILWPFELIAAFFWSLYKGGETSVKYLISQASTRQKESQDRRVLAQLEAERDQLNTKLSEDIGSYAREEYEEQMRTLESLITVTRPVSKNLAISSG